MAGNRLGELVELPAMKQRQAPRGAAFRKGAEDSDAVPAQAAGTTLEEHALAEVRFWVMRANAILAPENRSGMPLPTVRFDLRGRAAGMTVYGRGRRDRAAIRLNAELLSANPNDMIEETVPHEVAHVAARWFHGDRIKPHGPEWRSIMHSFGKRAATCHNLPARPARRLTYYPYDCGCPRPNYLSAIRHRRAQRGRQRYQCVRCGRQLRYTGGPASYGHPDDAAAG